MNRRDFFKSSGLAGAGVTLLSTDWLSRSLAAPAGGGIDPASIAKYVTPLVIPPAMPKTSEINTDAGAADYFEIAVRQFTQQILPPDLPVTMVWGYGSVNHEGSFRRLDSPSRPRTAGPCA